VLAVAVAYVTGQVTAIPSSLLFEHWLARKILTPPTAILIGAADPRATEKLLGHLIGRYYEPLPRSTQERILARAATATGRNWDELLLDPEGIFQPAFAMARTDADTRVRIDSFRNLYGFSRNVATVGLMAIVALVAKVYTHPSSLDIALLLFTLLVTIGMVIRFLKFHAAFAAEVLRAFASRQD
jgi:hypothetical protein